jgi:hypothetical protein
MLGNRHAPEWWQDPKAYQERIRKQNERAAQEARKFHQRTGHAGGGPVKRFARSGPVQPTKFFGRHAAYAP